MGQLLCGFTDGPVASSAVLGWVLCGLGMEESRWSFLLHVYL